MKISKRDLDDIYKYVKLEVVKDFGFGDDKELCLKIIKATNELIRNLQDIKENVLLLSIGCNSIRDIGREQQLPSYIKNIAKNQSVRIILIDPRYSYKKFNFSGKLLKYKQNNDKHFENLKKIDDSHYVYSSGNYDSRVDVLGGILPESNNSQLFYDKIFKPMVSNMLNDPKKKVFIGSHVTAYILDNSLLKNVYNDIKKNNKNKNNLQLYIQGGHGKVRYYGNLLYDGRRDSYEKTDKIGVKFPGKECTFKDLTKIDLFKYHNIKKSKNKPTFSTGST